MTQPARSFDELLDAELAVPGSVDREVLDAAMADEFGELVHMADVVRLDAASITSGDRQRQRARVLAEIAVTPQHGSRLRLPNSRRRRAGRHGRRLALVGCAYLGCLVSGAAALAGTDTQIGQAVREAAVALSLAPAPAPADSGSGGAGALAAALAHVATRGDGGVTAAIDRQAQHMMLQKAAGERRRRAQRRRAHKLGDQGAPGGSAVHPTKNGGDAVAPDGSGNIDDGGWVDDGSGWVDDGSGWVDDGTCCVDDGSGTGEPPPPESDPNAGGEPPPPEPDPNAGSELPPPE